MASQPSKAHESPNRFEYHFGQRIESMQVDEFFTQYWRSVNPAALSRFNNGDWLASWKGPITIKAAPSLNSEEGLTFTINCMDQWKDIAGSIWIMCPFCDVPKLSLMLQRCSGK